MSFTAPSYSVAFFSTLYNDYGCPGVYSRITKQFKAHAVFSTRRVPAEGRRKAVGIKVGAMTGFEKARDANEVRANFMDLVCLILILVHNRAALLTCIPPLQRYCN